MFAGRAAHFGQTFVAVMSDSGTHEHECLTLKAAANPFYFRVDGLSLKTANPGAGDFVRSPRWIVIRIVHLVHAGGDHPAYQPGKGCGAWRIQCGAALTVILLIETNPLPSTIFFDEINVRPLRRDVRAEALQCRKGEFTGI